MTFPINDDQFEEALVAKVEPTSNGGWGITRDDGWSFFVPSESPVSPKVGSRVRLYGKGIGYAFRGLFLDGAKVFYRTEAQEEEHQDIEIYGRDADDLLLRWDEGKVVWSIERGGIGPGYEQAIQVAMFEILRHLVSTKPDASTWEQNHKVYAGVTNGAEVAVLSTLTGLGLSGAQWSAAMSLAARIYRDGPRVTMKSAPADAKILVSRKFPSLQPREAA